MTTRHAYWEARATAYVSWKRQQDEVGEQWLRAIRRNLGRVPGLLEELGFRPSPSPRQINVVHVRALKSRVGWEQNTLATFFAALRPFLKWLGNPVAEHRGAWRLPSGEPSHQRWLTEKQLVALYRGSVAVAESQRSPGEQAWAGSQILWMAPALVALEGFNALRRIEVQRLRVKDLDFSGRRMRVHGKGRAGGKWRRIPMTETTLRVLNPLVQGRHPGDMVFPGAKPGFPISTSSCDQLIQRSGLKAGFRQNSKGRALVSNHDLRRTFGRIAYYAGMSLVDLKNFYGHKSVDMTAHYIGLDEDHMREGLARFDARLAESLK